MTQAVRHSPPTAGVPSSHLGHSMWVSWWTKRGLGRFFAGFHSTISPHSSHPFRSISSALVTVCQAWSAGTLATHGPIILGLHRISSLDPTLCWTRVEDILKISVPYYKYLLRKSALYKHYFNIGEMGLSGAP